ELRDHDPVASRLAGERELRERNVVGLLAVLAVPRGGDVAQDQDRDPGGALERHEQRKWLAGTNGMRRQADLGHVVATARGAVATRRATATAGAAASAVAAAAARGRNRARR